MPWEPTARTGQVLLVLRSSHPLVDEATGGAERRFRFFDETCDDLGPWQHLAYEAHRLSCVERGRFDIPFQAGPWVRGVIAGEPFTELDFDLYEQVGGGSSSARPLRRTAWWFEPGSGETVLKIGDSVSISHGLPETDLRLESRLRVRGFLLPCQR
jgi:hypothetical protein